MGFFERKDFTGDELPVDIHENATAESTGFEKKGYELHQEHTLTCPSCNSSLVSIIEVKRGCPCLELKGKDYHKVFDKVRIRANCPRCNISSFYQKLENCKFFYQACEPLGINDVDINENNGDINLVLQIKKKVK